MTRLALVCIIAAVAEALILQSLGFASALPLAPQVSAPAPFGVFHDLRWVFTYAWSWQSALWQLIAAWMFRALFDTMVIRAAWPAEAPCPSLPRLLGRTLRYTAAAIVVVSPWAACSFAAGVVSFGWFLIGAMAAVLLTAFAMPPGLISGRWLRMAPWRTMALLAGAWIALMIAALAMTFSPPWVTLLVAAGGGWVNALIWRRVARSVIAAAAPRSRIPTAPLALAFVIALFVVGGGWLYGAVRTSLRRSQHGSPPFPTPNAAALSGQQGIVFVAGFDSSYDGGEHQLLGPGLVTWYFSYAGLDDQGRPRAYGPTDTYQSLDRSAHLLAEEINELHALTGRRVVVVAESEGTLVAHDYFATVPNPPVSDDVESSPLMRPAMAYYPPAGHAGYGWIGGWESRELLHVVRMETAAFKGRPDLPFLRTLLADAPRYRNQSLCPTPGVRTFMFVPLEQAVMVGRGPEARVPWVALPGWHATLLHRDAVQADVRRLLATGNLPDRPAWRFLFQILRGGAAAWQSPALPLALRREWHSRAAADPAFGGFACDRSVPAGR